jgi:hypothetical protein
MVAQVGFIPYHLLKFNSRFRCNFQIFLTAKNPMRVYGIQKPNCIDVIKGQRRYPKLQLPAKQHRYWIFGLYHLCRKATKLTNLCGLVL